MSKKGELAPTRRDKVLAALFYGFSSLAVIFVNKWILSIYDFPHFEFIAAMQFASTSLILGVLILLKKIDVPMINWNIFKEIFPISIMFLGNVVCGLGSTRSLNLPMLTALRRFSILMTMLAEWFLLNNKPSAAVIWSVAAMVGGACLAAVYDFSYDSMGYFLVFLNNIFTTMNGVWTKKASTSGRCSKMGLLFYNSLFSALLLTVFFLVEDFWSSQQQMGSSVFFSSYLDFVETETLNGPGSQNLGSDIGHKSALFRVIGYEKWGNADFLILCILASIMGSMLNYSIFLCTSTNSALTTSVIGCLKNVVTTYVGMLVYPDYIFHWVNFLGVNISIIGSLYYTYITLFKGMAGYGGG